MTLRFLSRGEIADRLGVTLGTVKQYTSLPEPDVIVGRNQGWAPETIDRWAADRAAGRAARTAATMATPADEQEVRERYGKSCDELADEAEAGYPIGSLSGGSLSFSGGAGVVPEDLRPVPDDSSGREPTSLSAAPVSGAGSEASHRIGGSGIDLTQRRGVDRRSRGA